MRTNTRSLLLLFQLVATPASSLFAGDCNEWHHEPVPAPGAGSVLYGVDTDGAGEVWGAGRFDVQISQFSYDMSPHVVRWTDGAWSQVSVPHPSPFAPGQREASFSDVEVLSADDVWAVGTYRRVGADGFPGFQTLAMHWNGSEWSVVSTPLTPPGGTGADLRGIDALPNGEMWACGYRVAPELPGIDIIPLLLHWNGSSWSEIADAPILSEEHVFEAVKAFPGGDVWCIGHYGQSLGQFPLIARWDGETWTTFEGLPTPPGLNALADIDGSGTDDVWVVGRSNSVAGTFALVLHWDGVSWQNDAPDASAYETIRLEAVGVAADGSIHVAGTVTDEPSPALPLPYLARRANSIWSLTPSSTSPESAWYRGIVVDGPCAAWVVGQQNPFAGVAARLEGPPFDPADINGDGIIDSSDLLALLAAWGSCTDCAADLTGDGVVDVSDLIALLSAWS